MRQRRSLKMGVLLHLDASIQEFQCLSPQTVCASESATQLSQEEEVQEVISGENFVSVFFSPQISLSVLRHTDFSGTLSIARYCENCVFPYGTNHNPFRHVLLLRILICPSSPVHWNAFLCFTRQHPFSCTSIIRHIAMCCRVS